jgi:UDP-N-acetylmuramoyl-L-alanyl-D-glutamate--2,6-diaminopimelate ligase
LIYFEKIILNQKEYKQIYLVWDTRNISKVSNQKFLFFARNNKNFSFQKYQSEVIQAGGIYYEGPAQELFELLRQHPPIKIPLVAVTGTNGKTSVCHLIQHISQNILHEKCSILGTLGKHGLTMLDFPEFCQEIINLKPDIQRMAFEASSQGLHQNRLYHKPIDTGIFTNFSQDHLDYHKNMDEYLEAKLILFKKNVQNHAIVFQDMESIEKVFRSLNQTQKHLGYGVDTPKMPWDAYLQCDPNQNMWVYWVKNQKRLEIPYQCPLTGTFQHLNYTAAVFSFLCERITKDFEITPEGKIFLEKLLKLPSFQISGRMEKVESKGIKVFIDYAHTPDALEHALQACQNDNPQKLYCVFGCGGDRDPFKRPLMAKIASKYAQEVILTSDNPRNEDPQKILKDILKGFPLGFSYQIIESREEALKSVLEKATSGDIILIAGKGHEKIQIVGNQTYLWDDKDFVQRFFAIKET